MENRTTILNELKEISPRLAQTSLQQPYTVPAGYFEGLAGQILQRIQAEENMETVLPAAINPYEAPQGYFEGLAAQLLQRVQRHEEQLSAALQQAKSNPYQVPQSYFENLPAAILQRIKASEASNASEELGMLSPLLKQIGKKTPFSTPAGYFDELTENAITGAQAIDFVNEELENLSPLMASLQHQQAYEAPAGYFEQLPGQLLKAAKAQQPARVVGMNVRRRVMQYAAAAVVAGVLFFAGWMYFGNTSTGTGPEVTPVMANNLKKISDESLETYIENQSILPVEPAITDNVANADFDANDMKEMLADISDEDLQQYIDKYNTSKDILTN